MVLVLLGTRFSLNDGVAFYMKAQVLEMIGMRTGTYVQVVNQNIAKILPAPTLQVASTVAFNLTPIPVIKTKSRTYGRRYTYAVLFIPVVCGPSRRSTHKLRTRFLFACYKYRYYDLDLI